MLHNLIIQNNDTDAVLSDQHLLDCAYGYEYVDPE